MLRECVELCPEDKWATILDAPPRTYWRVVYHAAFYTHFYLGQTQSDFVAWEKHLNHGMMTFADEGEELPPADSLVSQADLLEYIDLLMERMEGMIDVLDLESPDSGFPWYPNFPKIDHVLLTLRHLGVHVGQLQELLFDQGLDPDWISRR